MAHNNHNGVLVFLKKVFVSVSLSLLLYDALVPNSGETCILVV